MWHSDALSSQMLLPVMIQWATDHPPQRNVRQRQHRQVTTVIEKAQGTELRSDHDSDDTEEVFLASVDSKDGFDMDSFLLEAQPEFLSGSTPVVHILYWLAVSSLTLWLKPCIDNVTKDGCTPLSLEADQEKVLFDNSNIFSLIGDLDVHDTIIDNSDTTYNFFDVVTGTWTELLIATDSVYHPGEIVCFKKHNVIDCPGLLAVVKYHEFISSKLVRDFVLSFGQQILHFGRVLTSDFAWVILQETL
jgi:hypothetical protein